MSSMACGGICTSPTGCTFGAVSYDYQNKYNLSAIGWDKCITSFEYHLNQTSPRPHILSKAKRLSHAERV